MLGFYGERAMAFWGIVSTTSTAGEWKSEDIPNALLELKTAVLVKGKSATVKFSREGSEELNVCMLNENFPNAVLNMTFEEDCKFVVKGDNGAEVHFTGNIIPGENEEDDFSEKDMSDSDMEDEEEDEEAPALVENTPAPTTRPATEVKPAEPKAKAAPKEAAKPAAKEAAKPAAKEAAKPAAKEAPKPAAKEAPKPAAKEAPKPAAKEAAKPAAKEAAKPAPKEAAKPAAKEATTPAPKEAAKPAAKEAAKPAPKEAPKPAAKEAAKPAAKEAAKPAAKEAAKPAAKEAAKPAAKEAAKPAPKEAAKPEEQQQQGQKRKAEDGPAIGMKKKLPSGVGYEVTAMGDPKMPIAAKGKKATVRYTGRLAKNGKKFDSGALTFSVGMGEMIPGFDQGVNGMMVGEKRKIFIPSHLGYGTRGCPPDIPGNSDLIFEVEVTKVGFK